MKRGLVIGKFMPVHEGHIALIRFGASLCDELIVSMSFTEHDVIDPDLRFDWLKQIFHDSANVKVNRIPDDFDNDSLPLEERTKIWADFIRKTYPPVDVVFSSEKYGVPFAKHLEADHVLFDQMRTSFPVSATMIRSDPFKLWEFIPLVVRPYFVKKICFYGPESTGKTTLAILMAEIFDTVFVPEVAREMLITNNFDVSHIIAIGQAQTKRILETLPKANKLLFCDTDLITTQIYSKHYLNVVPEVLYDLEKLVDYDHYFLMDIDVPWVADGLRDLGNMREEMFAIFKDELDKRKIPYTLVQGTYEEREQFVSSQLLKLVSR